MQIEGVSRSEQQERQKRCSRDFAKKRACHPRNCEVPFFFNPFTILNDDYNTYYIVIVKFKTIVKLDSIKSILFHLSVPFTDRNQQDGGL